MSTVNCINILQQPHSSGYLPPGPTCAFSLFSYSRLLVIQNSEASSRWYIISTESAQVRIVAKVNAVLHQNRLYSSARTRAWLNLTVHVDLVSGSGGGLRDSRYCRAKISTSAQAIRNQIQTNATSRRRYSWVVCIQVCGWCLATGRLRGLYNRLACMITYSFTSAICRFQCELLALLWIQ